MVHKFAQIAFTHTVKAAQQEHGGQRSLCKMSDGGLNHADLVGPDEAAFVSVRDSLYISTVSETGWPYIQHRGGPPGFVHVINETMLGFIDYQGNRQCITLGNLRANNRVALFFMDYENKARLKLFGRARVVSLEDAAELGVTVADADRLDGECAILIEVEGVDWNCSKHIRQRVDLENVREVVAMLQDTIDELKAEIADLKR